MTQQNQSAAQYLVFRLGAEQYALPIHLMRAIERWQAPTPVPGTPPALLGIVNQRGTIMPVVDVRLLIGTSVEPLERHTRLLVARYADIDVVLVVDQVLDIEWLDGPIEPIHGSDRRVPISSGVVQTDQRVIGILDLAAVLAALGAGGS